MNSSSVIITMVSLCLCLLLLMAVDSSLIILLGVSLVVADDFLVQILDVGAGGHATG